MKKILLALILALLPITEASSQIAKPEYAARRDAFAQRIGNGVLIAFGQRAPVDDMGLFRQLPAFHYLTGFQEVDAAFLMTVRNGRVADALLFAPARDPRMQLYEGFLPESTAVVRDLGLGLRKLEHLRPTLDARIAEGLPVFTLHDVATRDAMGDSLTRGTRFLAGITKRDAHRMLDSLRVRKSPAEVALLRKAIDITMLGIDAAYKAIRPGVTEAFVQATAEHAWRINGADGPAYGGIVGSGPNSTSYHYRAGHRVMKAGEVVVMDIGALYQGYAADVTRTAPVSGKWTADQRAIYDIVLAAQQAAERVTRAGVRVQVGDSAVRAVEAAGLTKLGLIESPEATFDPPWANAQTCERRPLSCKQVYLFMAHGLGHGIGLEVHDAGGYSYSPTGSFQVGEVFTIEPGIYISTKLLDMLSDTPKNRAFIAKVRPMVERYNNIGIRIEDDYLVTENGLERLSLGPRTADEIERAMRRN
ncbi:MAG TPA: aminopeptidase P N-terminal domain-containing protein [Longimicrobiales bacterium]